MELEDERQCFLDEGVYDVVNSICGHVPKLCRFNMKVCCWQNAVSKPEILWTFWRLMLWWTPSKCSFECRCMSQPFGELKISPFGCEMRPDWSFSTGKCEMPYGQRGKSPENWQSLGFNGFNPEDWGYHNLMESPTRKETQEKIGTGKGGLCVPLFFTEFFSPSSWQRSCLES